MKKNKDSRITVKNLKTKLFFILFAVFFVIASGFPAIYFSMPHKEYVDELYAVFAVTSFLIVASGIAIAVIFTIYNKFINQPVEALSDAARKVAKGDFSIRLKPCRKDEKKDTLAVLFDDFNTMVAELQSVEMLKTDFVSNVSHELKTPLAVIQTYSTMLQSEDLSDAERREYSAKISEATKRMTELVTNILQLSRLENQKITANKKPYVLSEQLCRCTLNFEQILDEKEIELETNFDESIILNSDEQLLDIVFNNLLSNALKFTDNGGTVRITAKQENDYAVISVSDNGCGMTESQMKHIFEKFYQADTSHATKGNGLGLALTNRIIILLGGSIDVKSEAGKGSLFTVKIKLN